MIKSLQKVSTQDKDLQAMQDRLESFLVPFINCVLIDGLLLKNVSLLAASTTNVEHKLGRALIGWYVVDSTANSTIWRDTTVELPTTTLALKCSSDVTVSLWVF